MKTISIIIAAVLLCGISSIWAVPKEISDEAVAIVNNETITYSELLKEGGDNVKGDPDRVLENGMTVKEAREIVLEQLIRKKILDQEVEKYGIVVKDKEIESAIEQEMAIYGLTKTELLERLAKENLNFSDYKKEKEYSIKKQKLVSKKIGAHIIVTEEEIQNYFKEHESEFADLKQYRVSEIVIPIPADVTSKELLSLRNQMDEIRRMAVGGADFAELAKKHSKAPDAPEGGDMGFIQPKDVGAGFSMRLKIMKVGEVSEVLATPMAFLIFKLTDTKPIPGGVKVEDVRADIVDILTNQRKIQLFNKWLEQIREEAFVQKML
ncbi:MAG: SurA N-terminal domain-containing protein [Deltaproteobacteria bacterium]|uniref:SurA N-terminal domain-containing protein n=1 Tax=Candidatus Zymogenus saltonus TaxID=2844893 RepID=A0A9D8KEK0_9DELT|nr:SurA N-terminal domain-containing protein [Candidatus Zymogenus saltonus]